MSLQSYFYDQRRKNRPQKRIKKSADDYSIFGDHRSFIKSIKKKVSLTFSDQGDITDGAASTVTSVHGIVPTKPKSAKHRPPSAKQTSPSKEATLKALPNTLQLPHIPSNLGAGPTSPPNIVAQPSKQLLKKDIKLSPANQKVLEAVEAEGPEQDRHRHPNYTFSELKFLATGILSQLSKLLCKYTQNKPEGFHIAEDLESELLRDYYQLCVDVVIEKREWQTDCYFDQVPDFSRPFFTSVPEEEERKLIESKRAEIEQKKVKMSEAAKKLYAAKSPTSRPATSHSRASLHSAISSDVGGISTVEDDRESRLAPSEYDMLPLSLCPKGPTILSYRRESTSKAFEFSGPKTRFEKFKQNVNANRRGKNAKRIDVSISTKLSTDVDKIEETEQEKPQEEAVITMHHGNMINFSMCDKFLKKGWIVCPDERKDPEGFTLLQWAKGRLSKILEEKSEAELVAKQRGEDGPLIIRFYDEYGNRAHRRQMKTIVLPVPPGVRVGVAKTTVQVPVDPPTEPSNAVRRKRFLTLLCDGSGFCNYLSGNTAITTCRKGDGSRGLYAFVYGDEAHPKMLAWFTPYGKMACYYHSGNLQMLANSEGGKLMDEDGNVTRQWKWPTVTCKLPQSVIVQLNVNITFRCYSHVNAFLYFSSHGISYKFDVSMKHELKDPEVVESTSSFLMTDFKFSSYAAAEVSGKPTNLGKKRHHGVSPKVSFSRASSISENVFRGETNSAEDEIIAEELSTYQEKIKSLVDSWLGHYRISLGIKRTPMTVSKANKPPLLNRSQTASPRSVFSGDDGEPLSRTGTRMTGSRPHSRSSTYPMSPRPVSDFGFVDIASPQPVHSTTVHSRIILKRSPTKIDQTKPKTDLSIQKVISGCPEAVRVMKLNGLSSPPQCKCDKHKLPLIFDNEFDTFLESHVPADQLVIVYIALTSSKEKPNPTEAMLDAIHVKQNRNRSSPCLQLSKENFRILKYDLATCADPSNNGLPLLVQRHNVQPGMFLMYFNGRLVMADNTFNGYSNKKKDLQKQIDKSIDDGKKGHFLPKDFKLHGGETQQLHRIMKLSDPEPSFTSLLDDSLSASHSGVDTLLNSMHKMGPANKAGSPLQEKPPVVRRLTSQLNVQHTS